MILKMKIGLDPIVAVCAALLREIHEALGACGHAIPGATGLPGAVGCVLLVHEKDLAASTQFQPWKCWPAVKLWAREGRFSRSPWSMATSGAA